MELIWAHGLQQEARELLLVHAPSEYGGALLCRYLLDMPLTQYVYRVNYAISPSTFWVGLLKAPVFAVLIGLAGCYRGMLVRDSARELGRLVTVAVVQAIFFVILADALFAVLFMEMNI